MRIRSLHTRSRAGAAIASVAVTLTLLCTAPAYAIPQWSGQVFDELARYCEAVSDGAGGAVVVWTYPFPNSSSIHAQRIDASGQALWASGGVGVCSVPEPMRFIEPPRAVTDGSGGVIITWSDNRTGQGEVYSQRVDGQGRCRWTANGVLLSTLPTSAFEPVMAGDGGGGAVISWLEDVSDTKTDVYAQRIDGNGNPLWAPGGIGVRSLPTSTGDADWIDVVCVSPGTTSVEWSDPRSGYYEVYVQKIDGNGNCLWAVDGIPLAEGFFSALPVGVADGAGGAVICYQAATRLNGDWDVYAQRLDADGNKQWDYGTMLSTSEKSTWINSYWDRQYPPWYVTPLADGTGGFIVCWGNGNNAEKIHVQRLSPRGFSTWQPDGILLSCPYPYDYAWLDCSTMRAVPDGEGGTVVCWALSYPSPSTLWAQHLDATGRLLWPDEDTFMGESGCKALAGAGPHAAIVIGGSSQEGLVATKVGDYARTFYFAEGTCRPGFDTYLCIFNRGAEEAEVETTYMKGDGTSEIQTIRVAAMARYTISAKDRLGEGNDAAHDFSTRIECTNGQPLVIERPMYFDYDPGAAGVGPGTWTGGHDIMGIIRPADSALFAEGTCRPGFDPYLCVMNPGDRDADVTIYYGGDVDRQRTIDVPGGSRSTVRVRDDLGEGEDTDFRVSLSGSMQDIIVERPMYFDYNGAWTGGSDAASVGAPAGTYYFAEGTCRPGFETYFCIANFLGQDTTATITYFRGDGVSKEQALFLPDSSRVTVNARDILGEGNDDAHDFSAVVESPEGRLVVERPVYFDYGPGWTGGHDVIGATTLEPEYYFAEGTCRPGFETYLTIFNPADEGKSVKVTCYTGDGTTIESGPVGIGARCRYTLRMKDMIGEGDDAAHDFAMTVRSLDGTPILVERPMYFNYRGTISGGHTVIGAPQQP